MHVSRIGFLLAALFYLSAAMAQAKPNFTGTWKLNTDKSDFGPIPGPTSQTDKIDQQDASMKINRTQAGQRGEATYDLTYTLDGEERSNLIRGNAVKSKAKWNGDALDIETKLTAQDNELTITDKWTLTDDGKSITIARHIVSTQGELDQKLVMVKQ